MEDVPRAQSSSSGSASEGSVTENGRKTPRELVKEYDDLFRGLGSLKNYQIKLHIDESIPPVAQQHRRVPFHIRKKLDEELQQDEELGVIERIEGPIPWVSPTVVAPKPKSPGKIRVCVDMRQANKAIKRERHISPTGKEMIGDLNEAKIFQQIRPNPRLQPTGEVHHHIQHSNGPDALQASQFQNIKCRRNFQNVIRKTLEGIDGPINISDDILVFGRSHEDHDQNLKVLFQQMREKG